MPAVNVVLVTISVHVPEPVEIMLVPDAVLLVFADEVMVKELALFVNCKVTAIFVSAV